VIRVHPHEQVCYNLHKLVLMCHCGCKNALRESSKTKKAGVKDDLASWDGCSLLSSSRDVMSMLSHGAADTFASVNVKSAKAIRVESMQLRRLSCECCTVE